MNLTRSAPVDPDAEDTVRFARKDFRRRKRAGRLRRWRNLVLGLLLLALVVGGIWVVFFSCYLTAERVRVSGNTTVAPERIIHAAEVPLGTPLARVDLDGVRARVESIAAVRGAEVSRSWPHAVRIRVLERRPVAVLEQDGRLRSLDRTGVVFGMLDQRPARLPLVRTGSGAGAEALTEAGRVVAVLPPRVAGRVDALEVDSVDQIRLVLRKGPTVLWGSAEESAAKAEVLEVLLAKVGKQVREIDVSVPGRPTTR